MKHTIGQAHLKLKIQFTNIDQLINQSILKCASYKTCLEGLKRDVKQKSGHG